MSIIYELIFYFAIYSFLGWIGEIIYTFPERHKFYNRGFLYGPVCPIYGTGALAIIYGLKFVSNYPILVFLLGMIFATFIEYATSYLMEVVFKVRWWDYSNKFLNINGRVCLLNSVIFGIASVLVTYLIHPMITRGYQAFIANHAVVVGLVLGIILIIDLIVTLVSIIRFKQLLMKHYRDNEELKLRVKAMRERIANENKQRLSLYVYDHFTHNFPKMHFKK